MLEATHHHHHHLATEGHLGIVVLACILLSMLSGALGPYVRATNSNSMVGAVSHAALAGFGAAQFFGLPLYFTVLLVTVLFSTFISMVKLERPSQTDAVTNVIWASGMALGLILIGGSEHSAEEVLHFMFGSIETLESVDLAYGGVATFFILSVLLMYHKSFFAVVFDKLGAELSGISVKFSYVLLTSLIAVTIVLMVKVAGIILLLAFMTLPAAIAGRLVNSFHKQGMLAALVSVVSSLVGIALHMAFEWSIAPTIALILSIIYLFSLAAESVAEGDH